MTFKKRLEGKNRVIAIALAYVAVLAFLGVNQIKAGDFVYVDDGASGTMDGSSEHPYDEIQDAIDKAEKKGKHVKIRKGDYKENIKIWKDVEVYGSDNDEVKIKAKDDDEPVVEMYDDTAIRNVTIKEGEDGIVVRKGARATINECKIYENRHDGIKAKEADTSRKKELVILNSTIQGNGWSGIYVETRKAKIEGNQILDNEKDGIDLARGSEAEVRNNDIKNHEGVGIKIGVDDSEIYIKKNTIRNNDRDGIEVKTKGGLGFVQIERNKLYKNEGWGIVRVERRPFSDHSWYQSLKIIDDNIYWENRRGTVSPIINVY